LTIQLFANFVKLAMILPLLAVGSADWNDLYGTTNIPAKHTET